MKMNEINIDEIFYYEPVFLGDDTLEERRLTQIAKFKSACKVIDKKTITSNDETEDLVLVTFDIPENSNLNLPYFVDGKSYVVFSEDLKPYIGKEEINEAFNQKPDYEAIELMTDDEGDYVLLCYDKEYNEEFEKWLGRNTQDKKSALLVLNDPKFDISDELQKSIMQEFSITEKELEQTKDRLSKKQKVGDLIISRNEELEEAITNSKITVSESIDNNNISTNLLIALNSEKEAVIIYETLIQISEDDEEKEILEKIYNDEKEHIALLSALQAKKTADSVSNENKETLDDYVEDILETSSYDDDDDDEEKENI